MPDTMAPIDEVVEYFKRRDAHKDSAGLGFERVKALPGSTFRDNSTVWIIPTRGKVDYQVIAAWDGMLAPMNTPRVKMWAVGDEVGVAYNNMIKFILEHPQLSKFKYILTVEDDNLPPPDAHIRLLESIEWGKFDAVSGIYFTKGEWNMPMAYGDPYEYKRTGVLDFRPRDVVSALNNGTIMEVNGIAMGCALWRLDLFRQVPPPWYVTVSDVTPEGPAAFTQDLYFCKNALKLGKRFAVDFRVRVGHLDVNTGQIY